MYVRINKDCTHTGRDAVGGSADERVATAAAPALPGDVRAGAGEVRAGLALGAASLLAVSVLRVSYYERMTVCVCVLACVGGCRGGAILGRLGPGE